jgi:hypothetical protein
VNDLDLRVVKGGTTYFGNGAGADRINNVEVVSLDDPAAGTYEITVAAHNVRQGPRQSYALVITGDFEDAAVRRRAARH